MLFGFGRRTGSPQSPSSKTTYKAALEADVVARVPRMVFSLNPTALGAERKLLSSATMRVMALIAAAVACWLWGWGFERSAIIDSRSVQTNGGFA